MAANIGVKIGIDGEAEYRQKINQIVQAQKTLSAEMKKTESAFDKNASAQEKNAARQKILEQQVNKQKEKLKELNHMLDEASKKYDEDSKQVQSWKEAVANAETELNRLNAELDKTKPTVGEKLQEAGKNIQNAGQKISSVGDTLTKNVTVPLVAIGAASIAAYNEVDDAMDIIVKKTGATGDSLKSMEKSAKSIAKTIPTSFEKSAKAVGEVNTRFGVTGEELEDLSTYFLEFADLNDTDVSNSVDKVQKSMKAFNVGTKDAKKVLDVMNATGQRTGVSMDSLSTSMVKNAASLQEMGLNIYQATEFLGDLEVSGADSATVMQGLKTALKNAADEGVTLPEKLSEFESIMNSSASDTEKLNAAIEIFGSKAGPAIYEACQNGGLSFQQLDADATKYFGNVQNTYESTLGPESSLTTTMNSLKATGAEVGETLLTILEPAVSAVGGYISELGEWYNSLDSTTQQTVSKVAAVTAVTGPIISGIGRVTTAIGTAVEKAGNLAEKLGGIGGYAGPVGLTALAIGGAGLAAKEFMDYADKVRNIPGFDEIKQQAEEARVKIQETRDAIAELNSHAGGIAQSVNDQVAPVQFLQSELQKCFDTDGHLNEGMEETAEMIVGQLNEAMGTDLSTDFGEDMTANQQALAAVNGAVDEYIEKMRQAAVQQAFNNDYGEYIKQEADAWAEARDAQAAYEEQLAKCTDTQNRMTEIAKEFEGLNPWDDMTPELKEAYAEYGKLSDELQKQNILLNDTGAAYKEAAITAAEASASVTTLEEAQRMLMSSDPAERAKALDFYANINQNAEKAGKSIENELGGAIDDTQKKLEDMSDEPYDVEIEFTDVEKETKKQRKIIDKIMSGIRGMFSGFDGVSSAASAAKGTAVSILSGVTGRLATIGNVVGAAGVALSTANSVLSRITGNVSVINVGNALSSAWSAMQSYFNNNPLTSYVQEVVSTVKSSAKNILNPWGWADGGIVNQPTYGVFGEAGPEAFIPLSASKRGRAMDLYRQVGSILGVGSGGNTTNNTNNNNISINVYAQPGQSANEIAEVVSRKINNQIYRKGAVFS